MPKGTGNVNKDVAVALKKQKPVDLRAFLQVRVTAEGVEAVVIGHARDFEHGLSVLILEHEGFRDVIHLAVQAVLEKKFFADKMSKMKAPAKKKKKTVSRKK